MPLTSHSTALDDIEMTRRIAETLRQRSMEASKMGIDGLSLMEKMSAQARGEDRQAGLDKQATDRLVLQDRRQTASDTRQSRLDAATKAERESTKLLLEKADKDKADSALDGRLQLLVKSGLEGGKLPEAIKQEAYADPGLADIPDDSYVDAAVARLGPAAQAARSKADLESNKTESEIAENQAHAARLGRTAGPKTPEQLQDDEVKRKKRAVDLQIAEGKAGAASGDSGFNLDATGMRKIRQDRTAIGLVKSQTGSLKKFLSDPRMNGYTGPLSGLEGYLTSKMGVQSTEAAKISSMIGQYFDAYKVAITGAAASDKEMASLERRVPTIDDSLPIIMGKLEAAELLSGDRLSYFDAILLSGDVRGAESAPTGASAHREMSDGDLAAREAELRRMVGGQ